MALPIRVSSAGKGVTTVIERCENAKASGYLDLSGCSLMYVADAIYLVLKGYEINKVNLRENDLKKFPKKLVAKFPGMTIVNAEGNQIEEIPEEFSEWKQLRGLNIANNKIGNFADSLYSLESLAVLDISGNSIEELDVDRFISSFPKLIQFNISGNPIKSEIKASLSEKRPKTMTIQF
ncbi:hypothetical protein PMAYCL1PPCAC_17907 [Pristionchus mayeri]|uniref:Uncharacterized protein n=1 Tax=Pristionchus mayeri TaxID=1317129 RepID=A0AAN5I0S3_9BILA|nr:hypothetical protein PMAYCL1PPCAC_17907 [Pristionchus mayeri]